MLHQRGDADRAEELYRRALALDPGLPMPWFNLGILLLDAGRPADALQPLARAAELEPAAPEWLLALARAQSLVDRPVDACRTLERALALAPDFAQLHDQLGLCLLAMGEAHAAVAAHRKAWQLDEASQTAASNYLLAQNYDPDVSAQEIFAAHRRWGDRYDGLQAGAHANSRDAARRLRVAYVSPDLKRHPVAYFLEPVLVHRDRAAFEVIVYSDTVPEDDMSALLLGRVDAWKRTAELDNASLGEQIRRDGIDVLVDLAGHTAGGRRMPLFAAKPAPVQASWLGYLNTTGLKAMDYRITDVEACPAGWERFHTESIVRLPHSQWCALDVRKAEAPGRASAGMVFGALHNFAKVSGQVIGAWARVLKSAPGSRLLMLVPGAEQLQGRVAAQFAEGGVDPARIKFEGRLSFDRFLALHEAIDVNLDAFPYAGGTTTCHSLWMGVPVVTLAGQTPASRGGASLLRAVGLDELVAASVDEYVEIAARLAAEPGRLAALRAGLPGRMAGSPLADGHGFTRALEAAYREMWRAWCRSG